AALRFVGPRDRPTAVVTLEALRSVIKRELHSDVDSIVPGQTDKALPFPETGELGFSDGFDRGHLTVTVGFASSAMDVLQVPPDKRPQDLVDAPFAALGLTPQLPGTAYWL